MSFVRTSGTPIIESLERRTLCASAGLAAAYFAKVSLVDRKFTRVDSTVDFDWKAAPPATSLGNDGFSVRWTGQVMPKFSGTYTFYAKSSGGVRVWVNNVLTIDAWTDHALREDQGAAKFSAGQKYDIRIDYWTSGNKPEMELEWRSSRQSRQVVPSGRLFAATLDAVKPTTPGNLRVTSKTDTSVSLEWNASTDPSGVVGYDIFVGKSKVGTTLGGVRNFTRVGMAPQTNYTFSVQAIDAAANLSVGATTAVVTAAPSNVAPSTPTGLKIDYSLRNAICLSWNAATDDTGVPGYRVYRNGVEIAATTATKFLDTGLIRNTSYTYTVRAVDAAPLYSGYSTSVTGMTRTRIMALGDSITQQSVASPSYRYYLWHKLKTAGYIDIDFVGSQTQGWDGPMPLQDFDLDHEGHINWAADVVADNIVNLAKANVPDFVLLHIGTNDLRMEDGVASTIADISTIIDRLRSVNPNVTVLLAQILPVAGIQSLVTQFNLQIGLLGLAKNTAQSPVVVVDMNTGILPTDMVEGLHPNATGDSKMADRWYAALAPFLQ